MNNTDGHTAHTKFRIFNLIFLSLVFSVNASSATINGFDIDNSLVPADEILSGGPPRDGIPALTDPPFESADDAGWLRNDDRVLGLEINGVAKAYPLRILNWHEIVNDSVDGRFILITYCPLCFSGMAFDPVIDGERHLFGVSGLLYNSDVLLFDRKTDSLWSQIMRRAITGEYADRELQQIPLENTTWQAWKNKYPRSLVLSMETGYQRNYKRDPYIDYRKSPATMFPTRFRAEGYHPKEPVIGITLNGKARAYPVSELSRSPAAFTDSLGGRAIIVNYDAESQAGTVLDDNCTVLPSTTLYWFAWFNFHPETEVYKADNAREPATIC